MRTGLHVPKVAVRTQVCAQVRARGDDCAHVGAPTQTSMGPGVRTHLHGCRWRRRYRTCMGTGGRTDGRTRGCTQVQPPRCAGAWMRSTHLPRTRRITPTRGYNAPTSTAMPPHPPDHEALAAPAGHPGSTHGLPQCRDSLAPQYGQAGTVDPHATPQQQQKQGAIGSLCQGAHWFMPRSERVTPKPKSPFPFERPR